MAILMAAGCQFKRYSIIKKHIAGYEGLTLDRAAADVNRDGE